MKKYYVVLILALVVSVSICKNKFNPNNYSAITKSDMDIVAEKMKNKVLPEGSGADGILYFATFNESTLEGPSLTYEPFERIFTIDVMTHELPVRQATIRIDSEGKIISATGYNRDSLPSYSYYSEYPSESNKKTSNEAKEFYIGVSRAIVDYIKRY